jgi:hypothetical protein
VEITKDEILVVFPKVAQLMADALGCDVEKVGLDAPLIDGPGAESIDFLDIVFRLERRRSPGHTEPFWQPPLPSPSGRGGQHQSTKEDTILRSMKALDGFTVGATDGDIGTVRDGYFDDLRYMVRYVVVDTGGGFRDGRCFSRQSPSVRWTGRTSASRPR